MYTTSETLGYLEVVNILLISFAIQATKIILNVSKNH
jgi:hypothetical protein